MQPRDELLMLWRQILSLNLMRCLLRNYLTVALSPSPQRRNGNMPHVVELTMTLMPIREVILRLRWLSMAVILRGLAK